MDTKTFAKDVALLDRKIEKANEDARKKRLAYDAAIIKIDGLLEQKRNLMARAAKFLNESQS